MRARHNVVEMAGERRMVLDLEAQRRTEALKLDGGRAAAWRRPAGERPLSTDLFKTGLVRTDRKSTRLNSSHPV